jgi:hypothetical protein
MTELRGWIGLVASFITAAAAVVGVIVAWIQLKNLNSTLRMDGLLGVLQLEAEINERRGRMCETAIQIHEENRKPKKEQEKQTFESLETILRERTEAYLNAVDRLAFCILKGYFPEKEWRAEYRDFIATDVADHQEYFGPSTRYTNILKLHARWKDS